MNSSRGLKKSLPIAVPHADSVHWKMAVAISLFAFFLGSLMSLQARINGELGGRLENSVQAALVSFTVGLLSLSVILAFRPSMRAGLVRIPHALRSARLRRWHLLGGLGGALFILSQVFSVPYLGVALFTVVGVASQTISGLFVDRIGLSPGGKRKITSSRLIAVIISVGAVILVSIEKFDVANLSFVAILAVLLARSGTSIQAAINARVSEAAGSAYSAALVSFVVGTLFLVIIFGVVSATGLLPVSGEVVEWWLYTGGLIGAIGVLGAVFCVSRIGVLTFSLAGIAGQVFGAVLVDLIFPVSGSAVSLATLLGSALALLSVVVAVGVFGRAKPKAGVLPVP